MSKTFQLSLAPERSWQAINPWTFYQEGTQFGFININLGQTPHPEVEQAILNDVGSYGRRTWPLRRRSRSEAQPC